MIRGRVGNREKLIFLAGSAVALLALSFVAVHAAGAASDPVLEAYGGDVDVHGNNIQNLGNLPDFFDTACSGSGVVSQIYDNGSYRCSSVSNTLSEVLASGNSAGSNNLDMNGNNVTGVDWLNPAGTQLDINGTVSISPDGDAVDANDIRNAGVVYAQAITGGDAPSYNFQMASENHLRFVADRDASTGGAYVWIIDMNDGSLNAEGDLNLSDNTLENVANPTSATHVGDRGYNDGRYVELAGDTMSGNLDLGGNDLKDTGIVFADTQKTPTGSTSDMFFNSDNAILLRADSGNGNYDWQISDTDGSLSAGGNIDLSSNSLVNVDTITKENSPSNVGNRLQLDDAVGVRLLAQESSTEDVQVAANGDVVFRADRDGSIYKCMIDDADGSWSCDGTKSWIHTLNETHEAVYTSQESPKVRAVVEDTVTVDSGETVVALPDHFAGTVGSDEDMTVQVTPHSLAMVAAVDRNTTHVTIAADQPVVVDYRVTGIRDGYEDKQVVRQQADK